MIFVFALFSIFIFIRTISYGIYEIKENNNTIGGIVTFIVALLALILPNAVIWINGLY